MTMLIYPAQVPLFITSHSARYSAAQQGPTGGLIGGVAASGAWPSANLALYIPVAIPFPYPIARMFWVTGGTATGNVDVGIYRADLTKVVSTGAVGLGSTNATNYVTVSLLLPPGDYYLGISLSSGSGTTFRTTVIGANSGRQFGFLQQSTAHPLPNPMVPATWAQSYTPLFGMTRTSSGY